jgi:FAD/FMN-containing dehydrogenase
VEAGVELQTIQDQADSHGMLFPLDLGARGSCTIGGNLSTNAGGNRVIRYGMTRELVIGVEAVLADGTVIDGLHKLRKNNTGYDLKQLFIGSEGTLGLITRAVLKLSPKPSSQVLAMCGVQDFSKVADLLVFAQAELGSNLSAFEVIWQNSYRLIGQFASHAKVPLPDHYGFYVLIESMGSHAAKDADLFVAMLAAASERGLLEEVVIADSAVKIRNLWTVRDACTPMMLA